MHLTYLNMLIRIKLSSCTKVNQTEETLDTDRIERVTTNHHQYHHHHHQQFHCFIICICMVISVVNGNGINYSSPLSQSIKLCNSIYIKYTIPYVIYLLYRLKCVPRVELPCESKKKNSFKSSP